MAKLTKKQHEQDERDREQEQSVGQFMQVIAAAEAEKLRKLLPGKSPGVFSILQK